MSLKSIKELFTNPDIIVNYSREKWSVGRFCIFFFATGVLAGFNFFWGMLTTTNVFSIPGFFLYLLLFGVILLENFLFDYILIIWIALKLYLFVIGKEKRESEALSSENTNEKEFLVKKDIGNWLKLFTFNFLIPLLIYNVIQAILTVFFVAIRFPPALVYKDYFKFLAYLWILSLTLYSTQQFNKSQKYKINAIVISAFLIAFLLVTLLTYYGTILVINVIM
jgi:hypothetical protein